MKKQILLYGYWKEPTLSLAKILSLLCDCTVRAFFDLEDYQAELRSQHHDTQKSLLLCVGPEYRDLQIWLWDKIRSTPDILNPIIILGRDTSGSFIQEHPYFSVDPSHFYLGLPWSIGDLMLLINKAIPMHDEMTRYHFFCVNSGTYNRLKNIFGHDFGGKLIVQRKQSVLDEAFAKADRLRNLELTQRLRRCQELFEHGDDDALEAEGERILQEIINPELTTTG